MTFIDNPKNSNDPASWLTTFTFAVSDGCNSVTYDGKLLTLHHNAPAILDFDLVVT